jgi:penicillin V acylase-like amidase (Ntn superfamily)
MFVNQRGLLKTGWEESTTGEIASWVSQYGSLTFNLIGYQMVWAGMNEAGLMLNALELPENIAPPADHRPPLVNVFWLQYLLDNYASVNEVISSEEQVRLSTLTGRDAGHYLVCDRHGDCAVIEFLEGEMVVYTGEELPVAALANSTYQDSVKSWRNYVALNTSLERFGIAADRLKSYVTGEGRQRWNTPSRPWLKSLPRTGPNGAWSSPPITGAFISTPN